MKTCFSLLMILVLPLTLWADGKPLTELTGAENYKGQDGGLYGKGRNVPPEAHLAEAMKAAGQIQPLDRNGKPSADGKVVLISIGMSNTTQEFSRFMALANEDKTKAVSLVIVDGAQGGQAADAWASTAGLRAAQRRGSPWDVLGDRIEAAGVTSNQVQVVWIKQALKFPAGLGEFPRHAEVLRDDLITILNKLHSRYPNLRLAYLSSRVYAGYATSKLNPEPYAFESAFSVRWVIEEQIKGNARLNVDPTRGPVTSPVVLWGPYLWGNGETPRQADGLVWSRQDFVNDGTHPSPSGRQKVAAMLLKFFQSDPTAKGWYLQKAN
jgi:hypothetical protein